MGPGRTVAAALIALLAAPGPARAQGDPKVRPPSAAAVAAARAAVPRGLVVLVQSAPDGRLEQATLFARVEAPQALVFDLLADPASLPRLQPAMADVEVRTRRGQALSYRWVYGDAIARIRGTTAMALAPPAAVQLRMIDEGFGPGEMLWRLYPEGASRTLVALVTSIDVDRASHPLLRWLSRRSPDFHQAWNLGYGVMALQGVEQVATREAGGKAPRPSTGEAGQGPLERLGPDDVRALGPLLALGRVAIIESDAEGRIAQATVAERVAAPPAAVQRVLDEPGEWGGVLGAIRVDDVRRTAEGHELELGFSFPAFSVDTDIALVRRPDGCDLSSPSGRLVGSLLSFRVAPAGSDGSVLTSAGRVRLRQGGRLLRRMIDDDPAFGHALNAALLMATSRAFAQRAEGRR